MKSIERRAALLACLGFSWPFSAAWADEPPAPTGTPREEWSHAPTVQELLRLDLEAAMAEARGAHAAETRATAAEGVARQPAPDPPKLIAIYGVGQRLQAEMVVDGQTHVLGSAASAAAAGGYRLIDMQGRCLRARKGDEAPLALCLDAVRQGG